MKTLEFYLISNSKQFLNFSTLQNEFTLIGNSIFFIISKKKSKNKKKNIKIFQHNVIFLIKKYFKNKMYSSKTLFAE